MPNLPHQPRPCCNCPFRRNTSFRLGQFRILEILESGSFIFHKTKDLKHRLQCAGHMGLMGDRNDFVQLADRLGIELRLGGQGEIFEDWAACVEHHSKTSTS